MNTWNCIFPAKAWWNKQMEWGILFWDNRSKFLRCFLHPFPYVPSMAMAGGQVKVAGPCPSQSFPISLDSAGQVDEQLGHVQQTSDQKWNQKAATTSSQTVCSADFATLWSFSFRIFHYFIIIESQNNVRRTAWSLGQLGCRRRGALREALPLRPLKARGLLWRQRQSRRQPGCRPSLIQEQNGASFLICSASENRALKSF